MWGIKETIIAIGLSLTNHIDHCRKCNEVHPSIAIEWVVNDNWSITSGAFFNSTREVSVGLGYKVSYEPFFAEVSVVSGYDKVFGSLTPFARVGVEWEDWQFFVIPSPTDNGIKPIIGINLKILEW